MTIPIRRRSHRVILQALASASRPLTRAEIGVSCGLPIAFVGARLSEIPEWVRPLTESPSPHDQAFTDALALTGAGRQALGLGLA